MEKITILDIALFMLREKTLLSMTIQEIIGIPENQIIHLLELKTVSFLVLILKIISRNKCLAPIDQQENKQLKT